MGDDIRPTAEANRLANAMGEFQCELLRTQYLIGVLSTLGDDVSGPAGEVSRIAKRGAALLTAKESPR